MAVMANDNDNYPEAGCGPEPDAHGQAAMLLIESLIFGLIERSAMSVADAIDVVDAAAEVKVEIGADLGDSPETMARSLHLLAAIGHSLRMDA